MANAVCYLTLFGNVLVHVVWQCSGCVLEFSDDRLVTTYVEVLSHVMAYLEQHLPPADFERVERLRQLVQGDDGQSEDANNEGAVLAAAKSVVLKSK